jgi:hypothetical protein
LHLAVWLQVVEPEHAGSGRTGLDHGMVVSFGPEDLKQDFSELVYLLVEVEAG